MTVFVTSSEQAKIWSLFEQNNKMLVFGRGAKQFSTSFINDFCRYEKGRYRPIIYECTQDAASSFEIVMEYVQEHYHSGKTQDVLLLLNAHLFKHLDVLIEELEREYSLYIIVHSTIELSTLYLPEYTRVCYLPVDYSGRVNGENNKITIEWLLSDAYLQGKANSFDESKNVQRLKKAVNSILNRIIRTHKVREKALLFAITRYLFINGHEPITARTLASAMQDEFPSSNHKIVSRYLDYLCEYQLFRCIQRYDVERECVLCSGKCYFADDPLFVNAYIGAQARPFIAAYKNVLALELLHNSREFYVATARKNTVDYIVVLPKRKYYIRIVDDLEDDKVVNEAASGLMQIKDMDEKVIIGKGSLSEQFIKGIRCFNYDSGIAYINKASEQEIQLNMKRY